MADMISQNRGLELSGNDAQLPVAADAPSIAVDRRDGEGQVDPGPTPEELAALGPSVAEHTVHFRDFTQEQEDRDGRQDSEASLRQTFGEQGSEEQSPFAEASG